MTLTDKLEEHEMIPDQPVLTPKSAIPEAGDAGKAISEVYIISGETGMFSDTVAWAVCAVLTEDEAAVEVEFLTSKSVEFGARRNLDWRLSQGVVAKMRPYDPDFRLGSTGTTYSSHRVQVGVLGPRGRATAKATGAQS